MSLQDKPQVYHFLSWHEPLQGRCSCQVGPLVDKLLALNSGKMPPTAKTEVVARIFADATGIRLADKDIEPHLIFPNNSYASREWLRAEYTKFLGFCRATGWVKKTGRPQGVLPGRPGPDDPIWPTQEEATREDALLQSESEQAMELADG
jgi:hypothetical protein